MAVTLYSLSAAWDRHMVGEEWKWDGSQCNNVRTNLLLPRVLVILKCKMILTFFNPNKMIETLVCVIDLIYMGGK